MRMMPVYDKPADTNRRPRIVTRLARLHYLHYLIAVISLTYSAIGWCCLDVSHIFDFPEGGQGLVVNDSRGIGRVIQNPVMLTYLFALICIFAVVVGTGLLKSKPWAQKWAWWTPIVTLALWVPIVWQIARWKVFGVLPNRSSDPAALYNVTPVADIRFAAKVALLMWAVVSLVYYLVLRSKVVCDAFGEGRYQVGKRTYIVGLGVALAVLVGLLCFRMLDGRMLIHDAASYGWTDAVAALTHCGQGVGTRSRDGRTPLHYAAAAGRLGTVAYLLGHRANINARDKHGESPAMLAGRGRYSFFSGDNDDCRKVLICLLKRGADLSNASDEVIEGLVGNLPSSQYALPSPDAAYSPEYVRLLLQCNFPINQLPSGGYTLMDYVVQCGNPSDIDHLLSLGAHMPPNLASAAPPRNLKHLLSRGFDVHARDREGMTALHHAVWSKLNGVEHGCEERVRLLVQHGADIRAKDNNENTPIELADDDLRPVLLGH